ncbi:MAG: ParB/RepB/Spo0J family partition protein [Oscillospiraceae bacterium]
MAGEKFDITKFAATLPEAVPESGMTREIPVGDILDNPRNFYPRPDNNALGALMESIQANGLLEPPTVVPAEDGKYRLISGHSRMAALRLLAANLDEAVAKQFSTVLCRVLPAMTEEQELCAVIEANRQRVKSNALLAQEAEKLEETYIRRSERPARRSRSGCASGSPRRCRSTRRRSAICRSSKRASRCLASSPGGRRASCPRPQRSRSPAMDDETQYRLLDWIIDHCRTWSINNVREFRTCWTCCKHKCLDTGGFCPNAARM